MRSVRQRDYEQRRERLSFIEAETAKQHLEEDQQQYAVYVQGIEAEQSRVPRALRIEPLDFETFKRFMPDESDPALRGAIAINRALIHRTAESTAAKVRNGKDPEAYIDPATAGQSMNLEAAQVYNGTQGKLFREQTPWWYGSEANRAALLDYLERNGIQIASAETLRKAAERLREHGLLEERPEPQPEPETRPEPEPVTVEPETFVGIDLETGLQKAYTKFQVDRMPADKFKRVFQLTRDKRIAAWEEMFVEPSRY